MYSIKKTERVYEPISSFYNLVEHFAGFGDRIAYRYFVDGGKNLAEMTYGEFAAMVRDEAAGLSALGLAGRRVAVIGETSPEWVATFLAIVTSGGVAVPMDKELAIPEIEGLLASAEIEGIVYSPTFAHKFDSAVASHSSLKFFVPMKPADDELIDEKVIPLAKIMEAGKANAGYTPAPPTDLNRLTVMLFTSGTTGTSKCVMLSEKNMVTAINGGCEAVNFTPDDTVVSVLPIHHTYELSHGMFSAMNYGMVVCINDSLKHVLKNFKLFRPTGLVLVPLFVNTMYQRIMKEAEKTGKKRKLRVGMKISRFLRHLKIDVRKKLFRDVQEAFGGRLVKIISGGAPLNPKMCDEFFEFGIQISEGYGITECSPLISVNPYFAAKDYSVGPAIPGCRARIELDGRILPPGETGEIVVSGDNVMLGYYHNDEANAAVFTEDGWFRTGDMGHMDEDGYIYITGRCKSVIVLENGKNVFPEEIEEYLANVEGVKESVAVGRKAEGSDEIILTAIVVPDFDAFPKGATDEEIYKVLHERIVAMNKKLASFKQVRALEIRREEFPKTTSRKIRRHLIH